MCSWRRVGVARVFALRGRRPRIMRLVQYSRVGKNRDTMKGKPAGDQKIVPLKKPIIAGRRQLHIPTCCAECFSLNLG